jgi:predicted dehydrogenase
MKQIKWGIIGCGNVTEKKSGPAFQQIEGSSIVAVMRRDAGKAADYAKRHGIAKWYGDAQELIDDEEVNAIYIATPPDTHAFYTLQALEAGKAVYVEKPMALNYAEAKKMVEASEKFQQPVFVAYYRRALSGFTKIKKLIDSDVIGNIEKINLILHLPAREEDNDAENPPWRVLASISGGGYFFDLASHQLDWLDFVFGHAQLISSKVENRGGLYKAEDKINAKLLFPKNILFDGSWNFCIPKEEKKDTIEIYGEKGKLQFSTFEFDPILLENEYGVHYFSFEKPKHVQKQLIKQVVEHMQGKGNCVSTAETAQYSQKLMEEIVYGRKE